MSKDNKMPARLALLLATLIWGSSFVVLKNTLDSLPIMFILAFRFLVAGVLLSVIFIKKIKKISKAAVFCGGLLGVCLFLAYLLQTIGLANTTPGKNAFLTSVYCIIVPFLFWLVDKKKPDKYNIIAAVTCLAGIGLVSLNEDLSFRFGDAMTLVSGIFWALHIVLIAKFSKGHDPIILTILQFFSCGICSLIGTLLFEELPQGFQLSESWLQLAYMAVFCTAVTLLCQNWGQSRLPPSNAAILLSLEAVFGVIFSIILYNEPIYPKLVAGFFLIFAATTISETKLSFIKLNRNEALHKNA